MAKIKGREIKKIVRAAALELSNDSRPERKRATSIYLDPQLYNKVIAAYGERSLSRVVTVLLEQLMEHIESK